MLAANFVFTSMTLAEVSADSVTFKETFKNLCCIINQSISALRVAVVYEEGKKWAEMACYLQLD